MSDQDIGRMYGSMNIANQHYDQPVGQAKEVAHPPEDVEAHARERLAALEKNIPLLSQKLAEMAIEKKRLERMLAALEGP